jgi:hypothetical protein
MINKIIDPFFDWIREHKTAAKIITGIICTIIIFLVLGNNIRSEHYEIEIHGAVFLFIIAFYMGFGLPWGFESLRLIEYEKLSKIPAIGMKLYFVMKLGLSIIIGFPIMIYKLIMGIRKKKKIESQFSWAELEREKEKKK